MDRRPPFRRRHRSPRAACLRRSAWPGRQSILAARRTGGVAVAGDENDRNRAAPAGKALKRSKPALWHAHAYPQKLFFTPRRCILHRLHSGIVRKRGRGHVSAAAATRFRNARVWSGMLRGILLTAISVLVNAQAARTVQDSSLYRRGGPARSGMYRSVRPVSWRYAGGLTGNTAHRRLFVSRWSAQPLSDLANKIRNTMPAGAPGSLSPQQSVDLIAHPQDEWLPGRQNGSRIR